MFGLVFDWCDEETGWNYERSVDWYDTKEELLEAREKWAAYYESMIKLGRLMLYPCVRYEWAEIRRDFQEEPWTMKF